MLTIFYDNYFLMNSVSNNKRIAKNTLFLYFRMIFIMLIGLYTSRLILKILGIEDFGIYNVVGGVVIMLNFLSGTLSSTSQRFLTVELGKKKKGNLSLIFNTSLQLHALLSFIVVLLGETVGLWFLCSQMTIPEDRMNAALWVYHFSVLDCALFLMSIPYNAFIIANERMSAFAYISIFEVSLKLLIVVILVFFSFDKLILYAILVFCVQLIIRFVYAGYCKKHFPESKFELVYSKTIFKEMVGFASWSLLGNIAAVTLTQGFNIMLNIFFGPVVNAARAIAVQIQSGVGSFVVNFQTALNPQLIKSTTSGERDSFFQLIYRSSRYSFFLLFLVSLPILIQTNEILEIWLGVVPEYTVSFVRIVVLISLIDAMGNALGIVIQATGKIKYYQMCIGIIILLIVPMTYLLLKGGCPPSTVFLMNLSISCIDTCIRLGFVHKMLNLSLLCFVREVYVRVVLVVLVSLPFPLLVCSFLGGTLWNVLFIVLVCCLSTIVGFFCVGFSKHEHIFIRGKINEILKKTNYKLWR